MIFYFLLNLAWYKLDDELSPSKFNKTRYLKFLLET